jgi:acyl-CoA thioester hydrolase
MRHATKGYLAATSELLSIHVNMATRRGEPFTPEIQMLLAQMKVPHAVLPLPPQVGRKLAIRVNG